MTLKNLIGFCFIYKCDFALIKIWLQSKILLHLSIVNERGTIHNDHR